LSNSSQNIIETEEFVGQIVMPVIHFNNSESIKNSIELVEKYKVGGFIIFNGELEQVRRHIDRLQASSDRLLLFGCDAERGLGQIVKGGTIFPFLMAQGAAGSYELIGKQAEITAEEMKYCGVNLVFAPVLDVNTNPHNPIVNIRSFSDNPETVAELAEIFIRKIRESRVLSCGKHFPGHGSTDIDSHVTLPEVNRSLKELEEIELIPFMKAIESGVDLIMVGHIATPAIENSRNLAITSRVLIQNILRRKMGFKKVVISDSFRMGPLKDFGSELEAAVKSLQAGCNIILDPEKPRELIEGIRSEIKNNESLMYEVQRSFQSVLEIKKSLDYEDDDRAKKPDQQVKDKLVREISNRSVCVIKGGKISSEKVDVNLLDATGRGVDVITPFTDCLERNGIAVNSVNCIFEPGFSVVYSSSYNVINLIVTSVAGWKNYFQISSDFKIFLNKMSNAGSRNIVVSFGSPYVIKHLDKFDTIVCSFSSIPECQVAVAESLLGKLNAEGKLPVRI